MRLLTSHRGLVDELLDRRDDETIVSIGNLSRSKVGIHGLPMSSPAPDEALLAALAREIVALRRALSTRGKRR